MLRINKVEAEKRTMISNPEQLIKTDVDKINEWVRHNLNLE